MIKQWRVAGISSIGQQANFGIRMPELDGLGQSFSTPNVVGVWGVNGYY